MLNYKIFLEDFCTIKMEFFIWYVFYYIWLFIHVQVRIRLLYRELYQMVLLYELNYIFPEWEPHLDSYISVFENIQ